MTTDVNGRLVKTTDTSLAILDVIQELDGATMKEIAEEMNMGVSTVHGHLSTLMENGYVIKNGGNFNLGLHLLYLGKQARRRDDRYQIVEQIVSDLAEEVDDGVNFLVEEYGRAIILHTAVDNPIAPNFKTGSEYYLHNTAAGKAILAEYSDKHIREIIDQHGLSKTTEHTITSETKLFDQLAMIRERGFAYVDEEPIEGIRAVAAVVHDADKNVFGALAIGGPKYRMNGRRFEEDLPDILLRYTSKLETKIQSS